MRIAAFDPGQSTGFAQVEWARGKVQPSPVSITRVLTLNELQTVSMVDFVSLTTDVVIVEDFVGSGPRDRYAIQTLKLVGFIEHTFQYNPNIEFVLQTPQMRRAFVEDARQLLRAQDKMVVGMTHPIDALAHILAYIYRQEQSG